MKNLPNMRKLTSIDDFFAMEELQRLVWQGSETTIVPVHLFRASIGHGGLAIGAHEAGKLIGFVYSLPGIENGALIHVSHMAGVHPDYRDRGLGFYLKRAQWEALREESIERICWTYDPLLSRNARLNIAKLGALCNTYFPEYYGTMRDSTNAGLPSDRFSVDLWVNTPRVAQRMSEDAKPCVDFSQIPVINPARYQNEHILPSPEIAEPKSPQILVEIPADFPSLRTASPENALNWRLHSRAVFQNAFTRGYTITDFFHEKGKTPRSFYLLSREPEA